MLVLKNWNNYYYIHIVEMTFIKPMKKLPMIVAIVVSIFSAQGVLAQDELAVNDGFEFREYEQEHQEYTEITTSEMSLLVQQAAVRDYKEFRIVRAYLSKDNTYKMLLHDNDNNNKVVFASATGEWITPNDNKS